MAAVDKVTKKRISEWVAESDVAFMNMTKEIVNGNGKKTYFPMMGSGAYQVVYE